MVKLYLLYQEKPFLSNFPGNTLTEEMTFLVHTLDFQRACAEYLEDRVPWVDGKDERLERVRGNRLGCAGLRNPTNNTVIKSMKSHS